MLRHAEHEVNLLHLAWTFHLQLGVSKNTRGGGAGLRRTTRARVIVAAPGKNDHADQSQEPTLRNVRSGNHKVFNLLMTEWLVM